MRRRLLAALVGLAVGTLLLYAAPRALMIAELARDAERQALDRAADVLAAAAALDGADPRLEALLAVGQQLVVTRPGGGELRLGPEVGAGALTATRTLPDGTELTLRLPGREVDEAVSDALVPVVVIGSLVVLVAVVLARWLARVLTQPVVALADHAARIGLAEGDPAPRSGMRETDELAAALDRSQARIAELLQAEREFSSNASHQLRTPLAALRLRVEDLTFWPETPAAVADELQAALGEIDRLTATVTDLLELARAGGIGGWTEIELDGVIRGAVARWQDPAAAQGRTLEVADESEAAVVATSGRAVDLVLDVLIENAIAHGRGAIAVWVEDLDTHVVVRVGDEGSMDQGLGDAAFDRMTRSAGSSGTGIGLALARTIAESAGGRLQHTSSSPTVFELALPVRRA